MSKDIESRAEPVGVPTVQAGDDNDEWRNLALQFDNHRMQAIGHLKAMVSDPQKHARIAATFLGEGPLDGESVLAERIKDIARRTAPAGYVLMPLRLTAENGAKSELSGEFCEKVEVLCPECDQDEPDLGCTMCEGHGRWVQDVPVEWTTIKNIYRKAVECCAAPSQPVAVKSILQEGPNGQSIRFDEITGEALPDFSNALEMIANIAEGSTTVNSLPNIAKIARRALTTANAGKDATPTYTTGHCEYNKQPGGCQQHNLHCGWPKCDQKEINHA